VVPLLGGTTTVVFFAGSGGLLLLMQPASMQAARTKVEVIFIVFSCCGPRAKAAVKMSQLLCASRAHQGRGLYRMSLCGTSYT